jgi:thiamine-monophosphate kinase
MAARRVLGGRAVNEFALIERFFRRVTHDPAVRIGSGDDAAVVAPAQGCDLVFSVDMLVEGRHFLPDVDPATLGHKALAVNLSDVAAMGATPRWALLAGALPDADLEWVGAFARGFFALADRYEVALIGGDTTRGPRNLCVTIIGEVPSGAAITRAGAAVGDDVYVSGTLGDAALALAVLQGRASLAGAGFPEARARLEKPEPRVALGCRLRGVASAALDVSDGLTGDLQHILDASRVGAVVDAARIPRVPALDALLEGAQRDVALACLLAGGDDYELCFTAPLSARAAMPSMARASGVAITRIGSVTAAPGLVVRDQQGLPMSSLPRAFDHFA